MAREIDIKKGLDWTTVWIYIILLGIGLLNIYAAVYNVDNPLPIYSLEHNAGKQIMFMGLAFVVIMVILFVDYKVYDTFAYIFYGIYCSGYQGFALVVAFWWISVSAGRIGQNHYFTRLGAVSQYAGGERGEI
jgi:cell division protein FtsW (lipid II flippase)